MEENSFQAALRSALSELKDGSMVELSERDPGFRQSEMEEHLAEQDWHSRSLMRFRRSFGM